MLRKTVAELRKELRIAEEAELAAENAKEEARLAEIRVSMPKPIEAPDFSAIVRGAKSYVTSCAEPHFYDEDGDSADYMFEEVLKAVYGPKVFDWINKCR